jgi:hypothetical protein
VKRFENEDPGWGILPSDEPEAQRMLEVVKPGIPEGMQEGMDAGRIHVRIL